MGTELTCCVCKAIKKTNTIQYKKKENGNGLDKHICRKCKKNAQTQKVKV